MIRKRKAAKGKIRYTPEVWNPATGRRESATKILGPDGVDTKKFGRVQTARGTYDHEGVAKAVERAMEDHVAEGVGASEAGPTVRVWVNRWLEEYHGSGSRREKESTRETNRSALAPLVAEHGDVLLRDFTRDMARLVGAERPHTARVAQAAWNDALYEAELGCIEKNVWTRLKLRPAGRRSLALTEEEIRTLADLAPRVLGGYGTVMRGMILFSAYSALRKGELCVMRHDWVDGDTLWVRASMSRQGQETAPKHRKVTDPPQGVPLVHEAKQALASIPRTLGERVWTLPSGKPLDNASHHYHWSKVRTAFLMLDRDPRRQAELERKVGGQHEFCWHTLRHSTATLLAELGFSRWDAILVLRHRDPSMVDGVYTHIDERAARARIVEMFRKRAANLSLSAEDSGTMDVRN